MDKLQRDRWMLAYVETFAEGTEKPSGEGK